MTQPTKPTLMNGLDSNGFKAGSKGTYVGKVAVRTRGTFNISTAHGVVTDIHHRFCVLVARSDGYTYQQGKETASHGPLWGPQPPSA